MKFAFTNVPFRHKNDKKEASHEKTSEKILKKLKFIVKFLSWQKMTFSKQNLIIITKKFYINCRF